MTTRNWQRAKEREQVRESTQAASDHAAQLAAVEYRRFKHPAVAKYGQSIFTKVPPHPTKR